MNSLQMVTFTGADDNTPIEWLEEASAFSSVEFGVLIYPEKEPSPRYPSRLWRNGFVNANINNKAFHLCGKEILNQFVRYDYQLWEQLIRVHRVQLNLIPTLDQHLGIYEEIAKCMADNPSLQFITQRNEQNKPLYPIFDPISNHSYLFDRSLGNGIIADQYPPPVYNKFCGYAGGLNPNNVSEQVTKIKEAVKGKPFWIDMQAGVRTGSEFDMEKVYRVYCHVAKEYFSEQLLSQLPINKGKFQ